MNLGEHGLQSESRSRTDLFTGVTARALEEVYKVNPNVVLVLNNGRPLAIRGLTLMFLQLLKLGN
jgi:beta-glucosidase